MLKNLIEKEVRDLLGSTKFAVAFSVCALLILLSFYTGAQNFIAMQRQFEAAKSQNLRQLDGITDWMMVRQNRIFLPPEPVGAIVTGVSNDIGRTVEVSGRGELTNEDSHFEDEPIFAVFRSLDLEFIFGVVLSLLAILLGYDAICGEKERGTLRLVFSNSVPRASYIIGKLVGSLFALIPALVVPILIGCLLLIVYHIPMTGGDWIRLAVVIAAGLLFFAVMLTISIFVSALTHRSSSSFLVLLVSWVLIVFVVPRASVLLAGRAVDVPSVDAISAKKATYNSQLWSQDRMKMGEFLGNSSTGKADDAIKQFQEYMEKQADERDKKMQEFSGQLNEDRENRQRVQQGWAFGLSRLSPLASFSLAVTALAGTDITISNRFEDEAKEYQTQYAKFMKEKTGMVPGRGMIMMRAVEDNGGEKPKPVDPKEMPDYQHHAESTALAIGAALPNLGLLILWGLGAFAATFVAFLKYDLR